MAIRKLQPSSPRLEVIHIDFESLSPFGKGYAVYMYGEREDYPGVPKTYTPRTRDLEQYQAGQRLAVQHAQDSEE